MGLEKVKERVIEEAKAKADEKVKSANAEARKLASAASSQAREKENAFRKKLAEEVAAIKRREEAAAKLESRKAVLVFRKQFIDEVLKLAVERLEKLPESKRADHIRQLVQKASREIGVGTIYCSKKDRKHASNAKEADITGGIIAESTDGSIRVDYSYGTLLEELKEELLPELNTLIFGK